MALWEAVCRSPVAVRLDIGLSNTPVMLGRVPDVWTQDGFVREGRSA